MKATMNVNNALTDTKDYIESLEPVITNLTQINEAFGPITESIIGLYMALTMSVHEKEVLYKLIKGLMLDTGNYEFNFDVEYMKELENYNLEITTEGTSSSIQIIPIQKVVEE